MALRLGSPMPSLEGASEWLQGGYSQEELMGAPVLIHFWAVSCYICKNNFESLAKWRADYGVKGLRMVAIHMPRQEEDLDLVRVKEVLAEFKVPDLCAVDNTHAIKDAFENDQGWVPAYFLYDETGALKSRAAGEAGVGIIEGALKRIFEPQPQ
jgi:thiol-disulfide isomerase/thioredoxin